jgi:hypothetical protein
MAASPAVPPLLAGSLAASPPAPDGTLSGLLLLPPDPPPPDTPVGAGVQPLTEHSKSEGHSDELEQLARHTFVSGTFALHDGTSEEGAQFVEAPSPEQSLADEHSFVHMPHEHCAEPPQSLSRSHSFIQCVSLSPPARSFPHAANKTRTTPTALRILTFFTIRLLRRFQSPSAPRT